MRCGPDAPRPNSAERTAAANPLESKRNLGKTGRIIGAPDMRRRPRPHLHSIVVALAVCASTAPACAQQWQTENDKAARPPPASVPLQVPGMRPTSPAVELPPNTTVVPRSAPDSKPGAGVAGVGQ